MWRTLLAAVGQTSGTRFAIPHGELAAGQMAAGGVKVFGAANAAAVTVSGFKVVSSGRAKDIHYANQGKKRRSDSTEGGFLLCSCVRVWVLWRLAGWLFSYSTALMPSEALAATNRVREALREVTL